MGAANCCKKPDEIIVDELKYAPADSGNDYNKVNAIDKGGFPQDTVQNYRSNVKVEEENAKGQQIVSNENLYEKKGESSKIGGVYEVAVNASNSMDKKEYRSNNIISSQQYESQNPDTLNENEDVNAYTGNQEEEEEEEEVEYNEPIGITNSENINYLNIGGTGLTLEGVDLNALTDSQRELIQNQLLNLDAQQGVTSTAKVTHKMEFNKNVSNGQQISPQFASVNMQQIGNANINNNLVTAQPNANLNQLAFSQNVQGQGGINLNNIMQQNAASTTTHTSGNIATVTPIAGHHDIGKYFKQVSALQKGVNELQRNYENKGKNELANIDMKNLPVFGPSDTHNFKQTTTTTKIIEKLDDKDLPEVFGSSDIQKFKQITTTTETTGKVEPKDHTGKNDSSDANFKQITTTITKEEIINMKDLPEVFGSSDIQKVKQITTTTTTETKGNVDSKDQSGKNDSLDNLQKAKTTITKEEFLNMKDLPEVFGSSDIQNFKKITTTTTTETTGNVDSKEHPADKKGFLDGDLQKAKTTITKEEFLNMKDLPEVFGSSDIQNFKKITTTTTTETTGNVDSKDQSGKNATKTTITKEEFINMKDLPEVFGSSDIQNFKKITTTTKIETTGNVDSSGKVPSGNDNLEQTTTITTTKIEPINHEQNKTTTTTTTTKTTGNMPIDLNQFGLEHSQDANQVTDYNKNLTQNESHTSGPNDLNPSTLSNVKQITTTTTTKIIGNSADNLNLNNVNVETTTDKVNEANKNQFDLKQFGIEGNQNGSSYGTTDLNDYNFKQTTTTTTTTTTGTTGKDQFDSKQFGIEQNQNGSSYGTTDLKEFNYKIDKQTSGGVDLNQYGITGEVNKNTTTGNEDYNQYFKETKTTTVTTTGNGPIELNQFGVDLNSLSSNNADTQQKTTTTTTTITKTGNIDDPSLGGFGFKSFGLDNAGTTQNVEENINTYSTDGTKTTTTKVTKTSYVAPTQSNVNQYNYDMPTTTTSTVTKTTYSEIQP